MLELNAYYDFSDGTDVHVSEREKLLCTMAAMIYSGNNDFNAEECVDIAIKMRNHYAKKSEDGQI